MNNFVINGISTVDRDHKAPNLHMNYQVNLNCLHLGCHL